MLPIVIGVVGLVGCRSHQPRPLDAPALADAFLARTPTSLDPQKLETFRPLETPDDASAIDIERAVGIALLFNPGLRVRRAEAGVAEAVAENAGLWPDPEIGLEFTRIVESVANPNELFGTIAFTIPLSGRLEIEKERLGLAHAAELAEIAAEEWRLAHELRGRWAEWSALDAEVRAVDRFLVQAESLLEVVQAMESLGELPRIEARLFRLAEIRARSARAELEDRRERSHLAILETMGLPPRAAWTPVPAIGRPDADSSDCAPPPIVAHPEVATTLARYEIAEKRLEEEIRRQWPDLVVGPGYGEQDGLRQFTLGLGLPIPIFNGNRQAIEQAVAEREAAAVAVAVEIERAIGRVAEAEARVRHAAARLALVEGELLPLVETQYAEARELARLGEVNTLILLDSLVQRQEAAVRLIETRRDVAVATIALAEALGPVPEPVAPVAEATGPTTAARFAAPGSTSEETTPQPTAPEQDTPDRRERGSDLAAPATGDQS